MHTEKDCYAEKIEKWPRVVKRGGAEVKIYRVQNRGRVMYQTCHWLAGKRNLKNFARFAAAHTHADEQATLLNRGHLSIAQMQEHDREAFIHASRLLKPLGLPLVEAVKTLVAATDALGGRGSLVEAAKEYTERHRSQVKEMSVAAVVAEFLATKEQDGVSAVYLRGSRYHLNPFQQRFATKISGVTTTDLETWLRSRKLAPRTRKNAAVLLSTVFRFARERGYLPKGIETEAEGVARPKAKGGKIHILTPSELETILHAADTDERKIYFSLAAFTGIRAAELVRLEWKDVDLSRRHVEIAAEKSKTAARRLVPIGDTLAAWLAPYAQRSGLLFTSQREAERLVEWAGKQIKRWPKNCLRHSFVSYRLAQCHDAAKTALEAGNSPKVIFTNYRELVTPKEAEAWFAIRPAEQPDNVVSMKGAA